MISKIIKWSIIFVLLIGVGLVGFFYNAYITIDLDANKIKSYKPEISSEILDKNGVRLAYIFKKQHRLYANFDEIPPLVVEALIATEDTSFFEHKGINPDSIIRAIIADIKAGRFVEGGSTLTQQLVKNSLLNSKKNLTRKIREAILSVKIENVLTKEEIIERYLNEIPYANNYYGIKTAAQGYFHKELNQLTLKEIAMLIGIPNAPSYYNPRRHYDRILSRANTILFRLRSLGWITEAQYQEAKAEKPKVHHTTLTQNIAPYIVDEVLRGFKKKLPDIKTGGYKIYTTIDIRLQEKAREALRRGYLKASKRFGKGKSKSKLNGALIAVENRTGNILAMVGGVNYKESAFNRATMSKRQIGSTFKPFIYQIALDMGYNPATYLNDVRRTFEYYKNGKKVVWSPKNYERNFKGKIPLRESLVHSRNVATVNLVCDLGYSFGAEEECQRGVNIISKRLKLLDINNIPKDLSLALGNLSVPPIKVAQMYTVFSNYGHMIEPKLVNKVLSVDNVILYEKQPKEKVDFTQPEQAYLMTSILKDVIKRGTGKNAKVKGVELAGKTGTTNRYVDAWFSGYSPSVTTVVWFGRDNNRPIGKGATGGAVSAPVFKMFNQELYKLYSKSPKKFQVPEGVHVGYYNGKRELYTKYSPLPTGNGGDEFAYQRPKLHEIGQDPTKAFYADPLEDTTNDDSYAVDDSQDNQYQNSLPDLKPKPAKQLKSRDYYEDDFDLSPKPTNNSNQNYSPSDLGEYKPVPRTKFPRKAEQNHQLEDPFLDIDKEASRRENQSREDDFWGRDDRGQGKGRGYGYNRRRLQESSLSEPREFQEDNYYDRGRPLSPAPASVNRNRPHLPQQRGGVRDDFGGLSSDPYIDSTDYDTESDVVDYEDYY